MCTDFVLNHSVMSVFEILPDSSNTLKFFKLQFDLYNIHDICAVLYQHLTSLTTKLELSQRPLLNKVI